ncbi:MAG: 30S ribosomal protein S4 [bacterium ADurb.Bin400]|nr:MAG: 30S ribosomal protein S4 [bacterium ADurb.Bin400]
MTNACEKCRRMGEKLLVKGERCLSAKCAMVKRPYGPESQAKTDGRTKKSEYGKQLAEKQKARGIYGLREKQFRLYVTNAEKMQGNSAENVLKLLELRLDNVVYRLGFAISRAHARQMVSHGLVNVNGKKVTIPSYIVKEGTVIEPKYKDKYTELKADGVPSWLELDVKKVSGTVKHVPMREQIDTPVNENLIIEYYSR